MMKYWLKYNLNLGSCIMWAGIFIVLSIFYIFIWHRSYSKTWVNWKAYAEGSRINVLLQNFACNSRPKGNLILLCCLWNASITLYSRSYSASIPFIGFLIYSWFEYFRSQRDCERKITLLPYHFQREGCIFNYHQFKTPSYNSTYSLTGIWSGLNLKSFRKSKAQVEHQIRFSLLW